MGCNCGDNEYNITVDNNGNCEPTTPIYNITLANVGVNGYSPIVRFVNETIDSFNIAVDNVTGTETSPAVPKLSYVSDQIDNINTTIANLGDTYLTKNGSNAANPIVLNHLTMGYQYGSPYINSDGNLYIRGAVLSLQATGDINLNTTGTNKAYYNNNEIATVNNLDTYLKTDGSNINRDFSITNHSFTINGTTIDDIGRIIGNSNGALYLRDAGGNTSLSVNSQGVSMLNNIGQSFTINNKQIATVDQIPTVGNGTITINQNGVTKGTFTTNQSGNTTIELDSGVTNPLTITDETSNNFLQFIVNDSGSYIRSGTQGLSFNGYLINTVDNPLSLDDVAFGLKAISLKYDNDTIKVNQNGQLYADVQGGGGAVDSVNGQTGTVVLTASDVGALADTVTIPTKTSDLTNDSGYITSSALSGYATETWVGQQGYLTSSDLTNYVTNSTLTTTLADYQPLLISGTNIKTINNTSLLGSGDIAVLVNTATRPTSLTIGENASTFNYTTNVGIGSQATATAGQAFGHYAIAGGQYSLALGQGAEATSSYAIQLGKGTNSAQATLSVGFGNNGNYQLLDGTTGLIPDARISSNIARASQIPDISNLADTTLSNVSSIDSGSAVQTALNGKVSKSGDTMTGALNLDMTTVGSSNENFQDITFTLDDINRAGLRCSHSTDGTNRIGIIVRNNSGTFASGYEASNNNGTLSCSFPNTTCVDGQWIAQDIIIVANNTSLNGSSALNYTVDVPNDAHIYEILIEARAATGASAGDYAPVYITTNQLSGNLGICTCRTRSNSAQNASGIAILPIKYGSNNFTLARSTNYAGTVQIRMLGYRRVGTNQ